jgi:hypothetical protein
MGPVLLIGESAYGNEWAQCCSEENVRMALMGPVLLTGEAADGDEWAQCYSEENMRMALNGPSASHN